MSYIGTEPKDIRSFGRTKFDYTASQGQTAFTGADDDGKVLAFTTGQINVFVNGILMDDSDFTTTGTGTVTLASAANLNDIISIVSFESNIPDNDYVPASGGTFTGAVTHTGAFTSQGIDDNANATAITIDSSEKVGIGLTNPAAYYADNLVVSAPSEGGITIANENTTGLNYLMFADGTTGSEAYRGYISYNHSSPEDMRIVSYGHTRFYTSSDGSSASERMRILAGGGITFNGDTAAANALDDYEEGTFTPSYTTSSSDASGVSYGGSNAGTYIKIGRLIHFQLTLHITSASSFGGGSPQIHGLPYSSSSSTPTNNSTRFTISTYDVNFAGGAGQTIHAYIPTTNVSYLQILTTNDNGAWAVNNTSTFTLQNNSYVTISGMYFTN